MATQRQIASRKKAAVVIEKLIPPLVSKVEKGISSPDKAYASLAKELETLNKSVAKKDPEANLKLFSLLSSASQQIGDSVNSLCKGAKANDIETQIEGDKLSHAVEHFAGILNKIGRSMNSQCGFDPEQTLAVNQLRDALGKLTQEYHLVSDNILLSMGDSRIVQPVAYPLIPPSTGCRSPGVGVLPLEAEPYTGSMETAPFDEAQLEHQFERLTDLLRRLLEALLLLALLFSIMPAIFCSSGCTAPFTWMPSVVGTTLAAVAGGVRPSFTIQWDYCCQNSCMGWWTDEFVVTVATVTYVKGPVLPANIVGRTRAVRLATRFGNTFVANVGAGLALPLPGCTPLAAYPVPPTC